MQLNSMRDLLELREETRRNVWIDNKVREIFNERRGLTEGRNRSRSKNGGRGRGGRRRVNVVEEGKGENKEEVRLNFQNEFEASEDYRVCCNDSNEAYMIAGVDSVHEQNQILQPLSNVTTNIIPNVINKIQKSLPVTQAKPLMTVRV